MTRTLPLPDPDSPLTQADAWAILDALAALRDALEAPRPVESGWIRIAALEGRLGVTRRTIDRWMDAGAFPRPTFHGDQRAWSLSEVVAWEGIRARPGVRPGRKLPPGTV